MSDRSKDTIQSEMISHFLENQIFFWGNLKILGEWNFSEGWGTGIQAICPTRWTVREDAVASIIENYDFLMKLWEECLETRLDPDVKGRITGAKTQMSQYKLLLGLYLCVYYR